MPSWPPPRGLLPVRPHRDRRHRDAGRAARQRQGRAHHDLGARAAALPAPDAAPLVHRARTRGHMTFVELCAKIDELPPPFKQEVEAQCAPDAPLPLRTARALIADLVLAALDHELKGAPAPDFAAL